MSKSIMIVTGEASGDLHGANLVKSLALLQPDLQFSGMGGVELDSLGVEILCDAEKVSVVGVFEVFSHLKDIIAAQRILKHHLVTNRPDLLIIIDLPDFNLMLAKKAKKLGIPVFYYITPQVWAWRKGRVKTIRKRTDRLGVILPFEEEFFTSRGVQANYVGHPLLDSVEITVTKADFRKHHGIGANTRCVGLLPGSRKREVAMLLPIFLKGAEQLVQKSNEKLVFLIPQASTISREELDLAGLSDYSQKLDILVIKDDRYNTMAACDCVVTASGTVTLELAILQIPMVVTYKFAKMTYLLGLVLIRGLDFFSLVNLIAGYRAVPELLQDGVTPEAISTELAKLLNVYSTREEMVANLRLVKRKLGSPGASGKAAKVALELLELKGV